MRGGDKKNIRKKEKGNASRIRGRGNVGRGREKVKKKHVMVWLRRKERSWN